jgi:hypothetical protein
MSAKDLVAEKKPNLTAVKKPVAAPQKMAKPAKIAVVETVEPDPELRADTLKIKDLLAQVVTQTGAKKKDAKDVIDSFLAEMGKALAAGNSLSLPPLGNIRVVKTQEKGSAQMLVLKLRMGNAGAKDTLAPDDEDS